MKQQDQSWSGAGTGSAQKAGKLSSSTGSPGSAGSAASATGTTTTNKICQSERRRKAPFSSTSPPIFSFGTRTASHGGARRKAERPWLSKPICSAEDFGTLARCTCLHPDPVRGPTEAMMDSESRGTGGSSRGGERRTGLVNLPCAAQEKGERLQEGHAQATRCGPLHNHDEDTRREKSQRG